MTLIQIIILSVVQGLGELLPVSSSAHVILAQKLMGIDPSAPAMTFLLVMLHTGTMFAVLIFFWKRWRAIWHSPERAYFVKMLVFATVATGIVGYGLKHALEHWILTPEPGQAKAEIESLFKNLYGVGAAVFAAGALITFSGVRAARRANGESDGTPNGAAGTPKPLAPGNRLAARFAPASAVIVGAVQGVCIPFRGFSRSGATISTSLLRGIPRRLAEEFSFALVVILTPAAILHLVKRLLDAQAASGGALPLGDYALNGVLGMVFSFLAGMAALKWLSAWLEHGNWHYFGIYCLAFSGAVFWLAFQGY